MTQEYSKNSLLGQLEQNGILGSNPHEVQYLPFGILTGHSGTMPFSQNKEEEKILPAAAKIVKKRLNDLDNNIFQEGSFLNIQDKELDKKEKTEKIVNMIKKIDKKIFMLEDCDDKMLIQKLNDEKCALEGTLKLLNDETSIEPPKDNLKQKFTKIENFLFKVFPVLKKICLIHHALNKLIMLNESAKELLSKKIPYGEQEVRYSDFITYLSCANVIHSKLTKKM